MSNAYIVVFFFSTSLSPNEIVWGSQIGQVFNNLREDFMKPVTNEVEYILNYLPIKVVVYNGQFDLIVNILGTSKWINGLNFNDKHKFRYCRKKTIKRNKKIVAFYKTTEKLSFYWILQSGHMVPRDQGDVAHQILLDVLQNK